MAQSCISSLKNYHLTVTSKHSVSWHTEKVFWCYNKEPLRKQSNGLQIALVEELISQRRKIFEAVQRIAFPGEISKNLPQKEEDQRNPQAAHKKHTIWGASSLPRLDSLLDQDSVIRLRSRTRRAKVRSTTYLRLLSQDGVSLPIQWSKSSMRE